MTASSERDTIKELSQLFSRREIRIKVMLASWPKNSTDVQKQKSLVA